MNNGNDRSNVWGGDGVFIIYAVIAVCALLLLLR